MLRLVPTPEVAVWSESRHVGALPKMIRLQDGFRLIQIALLGAVDVDNLAYPFTLGSGGGKMICLLGVG